ncbi:MAG: hypothetical protein VB108_10655 [Anaerolineaceae bacterium]|nr:hypothetical protein [Anaerolineaceae bacterium]
MQASIGLIIGRFLNTLFNIQKKQTSAKGYALAVVIFHLFYSISVQAIQQILKSSNPIANFYLRAFPADDIGEKSLSTLYLLQSLEKDYARAKNLLGRKERFISKALQSTGGLD